MRAEQIRAEIAFTSFSEPPRGAPYGCVSPKTDELATLPNATAGLERSAASEASRRERRRSSSSAGKLDSSTSCPRSSIALGSCSFGTVIDMPLLLQPT